MNIGTQLIAIGTATRIYYTPWFPKGADNAYFTYEIIHSNFGTAGSFTVEVFTKNREDIGSDGTAASVSFSQLGSTGFYHGGATNLRQLVRFKITFVPGSSPTGPAGVAYRIIPPSWYDKAV